MKLTPLDIRKHEFARKFRGYDPDEVRPFLEMVSQQWEELQDELRHAQDRVREMESKIGHYEKVEVALQEALEAAKASATRTQTHAEERARLIVEDAELKAEQRLREAEQERFQLRQDVSKLTHRHAEITARLRHFLMSELEILAQHEEERPIGFMKLLPVRDADALPSGSDEGSRGRPQADRQPPAQAQQQAAPGPDESTRPAEPEAEAPASEQSPATWDQEDETAMDESGTTYADLYARAARRARDQHAPAEPAPAEPEDAEEEPAWTLRSLINDEETEDEDTYTPAPSEKDHIRRILEDLD